MQVDQSILNRIRVASPCPANWEEMSGSDRVRFCRSCNLHVYDISRMSRRAAVRLIASTEGRLCIRMHRRADGTVMSRDCPVGLRSIRRRVTRLATAAAVAVMTLGSNVFAIGGRRGANLTTTKSSVEKLDSSSFANTATIGGSVTDPNGVPIPNAIVTLTNPRTNQRLLTRSNQCGQYNFIVMDFGEYSLKVEVAYFHDFYQIVELHVSDDLRFDISMTVEGLMGEIVIEKVRGKGYDLDGVHIRIN